MERITEKKNLNSKWRFNLLNLHLVTFQPKIAQFWTNFAHIHLEFISFLE